MLFVIRYVPDRYKTQETCDEAILENDGTFESVPTATKIKKIFIKQLIIMHIH